jgi:hypothetical protein
VKLDTPVTTIQWLTTGYLTVAGYIGLDKQQIPHSSVLARTAQQIGGSFGTAVLAVILETAIAARPATLADAFHVAFWWSVGFSAVAVLLSLWLPGVQRTPEASPDSAARVHSSYAGTPRRGSGGD